ncbi:MAG: hypothetical protein ACK4NA_07370 [Alphaproteobacteria bacterium]
MTALALWPTNIWSENLLAQIGTDGLDALVAIGDEYERAHPEAHVPAAMRHGPEVTYNLLLDARPEPAAFKAILADRMRQLAVNEGFLEIPPFEAVCTLRRFGPGEYAKPHNHRSVDYVAVLWLALEVTDDRRDRHQTPAGSRLHLIDPIAARSRFMNHTMLRAIRPVPGLFVIHPAHIFHTSEVNLGAEDTVALVTNIRVVDPTRIYAPL